MMKTLIRNDGETILETDNIEGIDWTTGAPLTNPSWCGGPYQLFEDGVLIVRDDPPEDECSPE